jgi:hypothetical protein
LSISDRLSETIDASAVSVNSSRSSEGMRTRLVPAAALRARVEAVQAR